MDYKNKIILAPMVRVSNLPFRLLALEYGADIVYSEEIIDYKMAFCKRVYNERLNTIDFCMDGASKPIFQTCEKEKGKIVFQLGTCDTKRALTACKIVENDVAAIDLNMGCPKEFSVRGGMGSALLKQPELVKEIVTTLVKECKVPITCKIRLLPTLEETIEFCKMIESCGASALTIHGRLPETRSRMPNNNDYIREITKRIKIPIVANGGSNEIKCYQDILTFKKTCETNSVMIARAAMWNCSVLRKEGVLPLDDVIKRYLTLCISTNNFFFSIKYTVQQMLHEELTSERGEKLLTSEVEEDIYVLFNMLDNYNKWKADPKNQIDYSIFKHKLDDEFLGNESKKLKPNELEEVICMPFRYIKRDFRDLKVSPKSILHRYSQDFKLEKPVYITSEKLPERAYKSLLQFKGLKFTTFQWEANKQLAEQSAAIACLEYLKIEYKKNITSFI